MAIAIAQIIDAIFPGSSIQLLEEHIICGKGL
jgi:hypothetical protein